MLRQYAVVICWVINRPKLARPWMAIGILVLTHVPLALSINPSRAARILHNALASHKLPFQFGINEVPPLRHNARIQQTLHPASPAYYRAALHSVCATIAGKCARRNDATGQSSRDRLIINYSFDNNTIISLPIFDNKNLVTLCCLQQINRWH